MIAMLNEWGVGLLISYGVGFILWPLIMSWGPAAVQCDTRHCRANEFHDFGPYCLSTRVWNRKTAARFGLLTPVWPLALVLLVVRLAFMCATGLASLAAGTWKMAELPLPRILGRREISSGQLALTDGSGGELSSPRKDA